MRTSDEDFQAACMDLAAGKLAGAGFERYEVASYAQPGQRCRHNIAYWTGKPDLGLGRSAAGMFAIPATSEMCNLGKVASYAQPGQRCRHNIAYWTGKPDLGLGRSAAGMFAIPATSEMCNLGTYPFYISGANPSSAPQEGRVRYRQLDNEGVQFDTELLDR